MSRKIERSMLKKRYETFCRAWQDEKLYQSIVMKNGGALPEGMQLLGKKPTFAMWMRAMENQKAQLAAAPPEKAVEVQDTSWEE